MDLGTTSRDNECPPVVATHDTGSEIEGFRQVIQTRGYDWLQGFMEGVWRMGEEERIAMEMDKEAIGSNPRSSTSTVGAVSTLTSSSSISHLQHSHPHPSLGILKTPSRLPTAKRTAINNTNQPGQRLFQDRQNQSGISVSSKEATRSETGNRNGVGSSKGLGMAMGTKRKRERMDGGGVLMDSGLGGQASSSATIPSIISFKPPPKPIHSYIQPSFPSPTPHSHSGKSSAPLPSRLTSGLALGPDGKDGNTRMGHPVSNPSIMARSAGMGMDVDIGSKTGIERIGESMPTRKVTSNIDRDEVTGAAESGSGPRVISVSKGGIRREDSTTTATTTTTHDLQPQSSPPNKANLQSQSQPEPSQSTTSRDRSEQPSRIIIKPPPQQQQRPQTQFQTTTTPASSRPERDHRLDEMSDEMGEETPERPERVSVMGSVRSVDHDERKEEEEEEVPEVVEEVEEIPEIAEVVEKVKTPESDSRKGKVVDDRSGEEELEVEGDTTIKPSGSIDTVSEPSTTGQDQDFSIPLNDETPSKPKSTISLPSSTATTTSLMTSTNSTAIFSSPSAVQFAALPARDPSRGRSLGGSRLRDGQRTTLGLEDGGSAASIRTPLMDVKDSVVPIKGDDDDDNNKRNNNDHTATYLPGQGGQSLTSDIHNTQRRQPGMPKASVGTWLKQALAATGGEEGLRRSMAARASQAPARSEEDVEDDEELKGLEKEKDVPVKLLQTRTHEERISALPPPPAPFRLLAVQPQIGDQTSSATIPSSAAAIPKQISSNITAARAPIDPPPQQSIMAKMLAGLKEREELKKANAIVSVTANPPTSTTTNGSISRTTIGPVSGQSGTVSVGVSIATIQNGVSAGATKHAFQPGRSTTGFSLLVKHAPEPEVTEKAEAPESAKEIHEPIRDRAVEVQTVPVQKEERAESIVQPNTRPSSAESASRTVAVENIIPAQSEARPSHPTQVRPSIPTPPKLGRYRLDDATREIAASRTSAQVENQISPALPTPESSTQNVPFFHMMQSTTPPGSPPKESSYLLTSSAPTIATAAVRPTKKEKQDPVPSAASSPIPVLQVPTATIVVDPIRASDSKKQVVARASENTDADQPTIRAKVPVPRVPTAPAPAPADTSDADDESSEDELAQGQPKIRSPLKEDLEEAVQLLEKGLRLSDNGRKSSLPDAGEQSEDELALQRGAKPALSRQVSNTSTSGLSTTSSQAKGPTAAKIGGKADMAHASTMAGKIDGKRSAIGPIQSIQKAREAKEKEDEARAKKEERQRVLAERQRLRDEAVIAQARADAAAAENDAKEKKRKQEAAKAKEREKQDELRNAAKAAAAKSKEAAKGVPKKGGPTGLRTDLSASQTSTVQPIAKLGKPPMATRIPSSQSTNTLASDAGKAAAGPVRHAQGKVNTSAGQAVPPPQATIPASSNVNLALTGKPIRPKTSVIRDNVVRPAQIPKPSTTTPARGTIKHGTSLLEFQRIVAAGGIANLNAPPTEGDELEEITSDFGYSDEETNRGKEPKARPSWVDSPALRQGLQTQSKVNPGLLFGPMPKFEVDQVFDPSKITKRRPRSSSVKWEGTDRLTEQEKLEYAKKMEYKAIEDLESLLYSPRNK